jgi:hypothetical protein
MVISMTAGTSGGLLGGREADRCLVALHAGDFAVLLMGKVHLPCPQGMTGDRHLDGHPLGIGELGFLVTDGAVTRGGTLVMANLAPAGGLERQRTPFRAEIVAGEAGESAMAFVGEGVAGGGRC